MCKLKPDYTILLFLLCYVLCSCGKMPAVLDKDPLKIPYMTKLKIETINGTVFEMKVQRTDQYGIHGTKGEYVEFVKIKRLERIPYSEGQQLAAHGIVFAAFILVITGVLLTRSSFSGVGLRL